MTTNPQSRRCLNLPARFLPDLKGRGRWAGGRPKPRPKPRRRKDDDDSDYSEEEAEQDDEDEADDDEEGRGSRRRRRRQHFSRETKEKLSQAYLCVPPDGKVSAATVGLGCDCCRDSDGRSLGCEQYGAAVAKIAAALGLDANRVTCEPATLACYASRDSELA